MRLTMLWNQPGQVGQLNRVLLVLLIASCAAIGGTLLVTAVTAASQADLRRELSHARSQLAQMPPPTRSKPMSQTLQADSLRNQVQVTQERLVRFATMHGCQVGGLQASPDSVAYSSPYILGVSPAGWNQTLIRSSLTGTLSSIVATLRDLRNTQIPIEPDSIDFSRQDILPNGRVTVQAQFVFSVLTPAGGAS